MKYSILKSIAPLALATLLVTACGGGSGGGDDDGPVVMSETVGDGPQVVEPVVVEPVVVEPSPPVVDNTDSFQFVISQEIIDDSAGDPVPALESTIGRSLEPLNALPNLFNGVQLPVSYQFCGVANAFYSPSERRIVLCDELTETAFNFFLPLDEAQDTGVAVSQALAMMSFVMYHEVGHALDDIVGLAVGGNFESVADAIGTVLAVETGQPEGPIFAALFALQNTEGTFADVHNSGADRAGDLLCWTLGSSSILAATFAETSAGLVAAGRDCVGEYADQFAFVSTLVPDLSNIPPAASFSKESAGSDSSAEALDVLISELLFPAK